MGKADRKNIAVREAAATKGPWEAGLNPTGEISNELVIRPAGQFPHGEWIADCGVWDDEERQVNAAFMAHARQDVCDLLEDDRDAFILAEEAVKEIGSCEGEESVSVLRVKLRLAVGILGRIKETLA